MPTAPFAPPRRACLQASVAACLGFGWPAWAQSGLPAGLQNALKAWGVGFCQPSPEVVLQIPALVENGASVAVSWGSRLPKTQRLGLWVEHNPSPWVADFQCSARVAPELSLRIKMDRSSPVYALALTGQNRAFFAVQAVEVLVSGCSA